MTNSMTNSEYVLVENDGHVRRIWLNRPDSANAQGQQLLEELDRAFADACADDSVRVVILGGKGKHFSAGHDLKEAQRERGDFTVEQRHAFESKFYFDYCLRIWDFPKPTISQVQGACLAGAIMLANMCDLMVVSDDAYFSDAIASTLGLASMEVLFQPWVIGLRRSNELMFTGRKLTASEAVSMGMANVSVPRAELDAKAMEMAQQIAAAPPFAIQMLKRSLNRSLDVQGFRTALHAHFDAHQLTHVSEEFLRAKERGLDAVIARNKSNLKEEGQGNA